MRRDVTFALGALGMAVAGTVAAPTVLAGGAVAHGPATAFLLSAAVAFVCVATDPSGGDGTAAADAAATASAPDRLRRPLRVCLGVGVALVVLCAATGASVAVPAGAAVAAACGLSVLHGVTGLRRLERRRGRDPERDVLSEEEFARGGFED